MTKWKSMILLGAGILVGVVTISIFQRMTAEEAPALTLPGMVGEGAGEGLPIPEAQEEPAIPLIPPDLTPEAQVAAERFRCICGCPDILADCNCSKDPGGIVMKIFLQELVDRGLSNQEIQGEMVKSYGEEVLLFGPAARSQGGSSPPGSDR